MVVNGEGNGSGTKAVAADALCVYSLRGGSWMPQKQSLSFEFGLAAIFLQPLATVRKSMTIQTQTQPINSTSN